MNPTDEQLAALALFHTGESMVIEAGAGTGKTSTLRLLAASTRKRGRYLAFNKAIVTDVQGTISSRVTASTAHSLAFRAVATPYAHRLRADRISSRQIAMQLGLRSYVVKLGLQTKVLSESFLGGLVMRAITIFCQTTDETPGAKHVPYQDGIDIPDLRGNRTYTNNNALAAHLEPAIRKAWADITRTDGQLRFQHDHYLKMWQLSHPTIRTDFILFDEAQDANPVMAAVIGEQEHTQRVYVGDSAQAIYEFTGAVNTLAQLDTDHRRCLSQSFRFGPAIAEKANEFLEQLKAPLRLRGLESIDSHIAELPDTAVPGCILTRTNAHAVERILDWKRRGASVHLVGGGADVVRFALAARELQTEHVTYHPELACFQSWGEVQEYVNADAQGGELRLLVQLVDEYGVPTILEALDNMPAEDDADLVVSTAHKSKGREWNAVKLAGDFAEMQPNESETRLRYVAYTRARLTLDDSDLRAADDDKVEQPALPDATPAVEAPEAIALPPAAS